MLPLRAISGSVVLQQQGSVLMSVVMLPLKAMQMSLVSGAT